MKKIRFLVLFFWFGLGSANLAATGGVIVLHGTSSAGKSSISTQLVTLLQAASPVALPVDHFMWPALIEKATQLGLIMPDMSLTEMQKIVIEHKTEVFADFHRTNWLEPKKQCYKLVKELALAGKLVILDTVLDEVGDGQEYADFYTQMQGIPVFLVTIYCPPASLAQHVLARNRAEGYAQKRDIDFVLKQFCRLYVPATDQVALDTITALDLQQCLETVGQDLQAAGLTIKQAQITIAEIEQAYQVAYRLPEVGAVNIIAKRPYDFLVHTGQNSAAVCAQLIYDQLLMSKFAKLIQLCD